MKPQLLKRISILALTGVLSISLATSPLFMAESVSAAEGTEIEVTDDLYEDLDGKNVEELQNDENYSQILEDPAFLEYYEIDSNGIIKKKQVETDEVDQFIAAMDADAEGIDDTELNEINSNMNCVGCGVSGLGKAEVPSKYKNYNRYNCIDISWWQGKISSSNWKKIKAAGVTHVIIRVGYSGLSAGSHNSDSTFSYNLNGAYDAGLKVGAYYYSTATTAAEARSEAEYTVELLKNYKSKITMPVAYDYEAGGRLTTGVMKKNGTESCEAYCDYIKSAGYTPMVYANYTTLVNYLDYKTLQSKYDIWLAHYTTNGVATSYPGSYDMWQYSSSGKINGVSGSVDMNYYFTNGSTTSSSSSASAKKLYTGTFPTLPSRGYFKKGDKGTQVVRLQLFLRWADCYVTTGGTYGPKTISAVKKFQKKYGMKQDGLFGKKALAKAKTVKMTPEKYTGTFPTLPSRGYFKKGDKGTQVKRLQQFLRWADCYVTTGGTYGPKTISAVKKFQKKYGMKQDGLFGKTALAKAKSIKK